MHDTSQRVRNVRFRRVLGAIATLVLTLLARLRAAGAEELNAQRLLAPDRLINVEIELPAKDWSALCKQSRDFRTAFTDTTAKPFTYFRGNVTLDGVRINSVGIRKKGFIGSLDERWPSLKINFDEFVTQTPVKDLGGLTLNNNNQDASLVSQLLTYRIFNAAGVHAPRSNLARVTVNGVYLGIYTNVEPVDKPFLKARFGNDSGDLFEGTLADFYPRAIDKFEPKTNRKAADSKNLMRLAELLASNEKLDLTAIGKLVDLDNFIRFWAVESLIGFWDGYTNNQNNYWVYESRGKLYFIPWGADMAFTSGRGPFDFGNLGGTSVYAESMLANRLYNSAGVPERYRQTMLTVLDDAWRETELLAAIDRTELLVASHLHNRQQGSPRGMNNVRRFIRSRRDSMVKLLNAGPAAVASEPRKPMYAVQVGNASGTFTTAWLDKPIDRPEQAGTVEIRMELDGAVTTFQQIGAVAQLAQMPRFPFGFGPRGGPGKSPRGEPVGARPSNDVAQATKKEADRPDDPLQPAPEFAVGPFGRFEPPATIVFTGIRTTDAEKMTLTLSLNRTTFASSAGKTLPVRGMLSDGDGGPNFFMPFAGRSAVGEITLAKAGLEAGNVVAGHFTVKITETHGGFMGRPGPGARRPRGQ